MLELEAGRSLFFRGPVARVAPREGCAGDRRRKGSRAPRGRHRPPRAVRRALPLQEDEGEAGAGEAHADRAAGEGALASGGASSTRSRSARSRSASTSSTRRDPAAPSSPSRGWTSPPATSRCSHDVTFAIDRGEHVGLVGPNGSGKTTLLEIAACRTARLRRHPCVLLAAGNRARRARQRARLRAARNGSAAAAGPDAPRPLPLLRLGDARAAGDGAFRWGAPAPVTRAARRLRGELPRARRADEPPRPREPRGARGGARGVPRNRAARLPRPRACSTPSRGGRSRSRTAPCARTTAAGPTTPASRPNEPCPGIRPVGPSQRRDTSEAVAGASPAKRPRAIVELEAEIETKEARGGGARAAPRRRLGERRHGRRLPARARGARGPARPLGAALRPELRRQ